MCTLLADISPSRIDDRALFSSCKASGFDGTRRCFWTRADCPDDHIDYGANPYSNYLLCPCEDTETGACYDAATTEYVCAVSSQGCDSSSTFLSVHELQEQANIDCRLCTKPTKVPDALEDADVPSWSETGSKGIVTPDNEENSTTAQTTSSSSSALDRGKIIAVSIVGGVALGLFLAIATLRIRRRRMGNSAKGGTAIVVETLDVNKNNGQEHQERDVEHERSA